MNVTIHGPGRPSKAEQLAIEKKLWPYFEDGCKPGRAAYETGINVKTVRKYFRIWHAKYISAQGPEFFKNCRLSNGRTILELDTMIFKLEKRCDELEAAIGSLGPIQDKRWMYIEYRKIQELLSKLYVEMNNLENTSTADVTLKTDGDEILKKKMEAEDVDP